MVTSVLTCEMSSADSVSSTERSAERQAAVRFARHFEGNFNVLVELKLVRTSKARFAFDHTDFRVARDSHASCRMAFSSSKTSGASQHRGRKKNLFHRFPSLS